LAVVTHKSFLRKYYEDRAHITAVSLPKAYGAIELIKQYTSSYEGGGAWKATSSAVISGGAPKGGGAPDFSMVTTGQVLGHTNRVDIHNGTSIKYNMTSKI